jgi:hypothetical protein
MENAMYYIRGAIKGKTQAISNIAKIRDEAAKCGCETLAANLQEQIKILIIERDYLEKNLLPELERIDTISKGVEI